MGTRLKYDQLKEVPSKKPCRVATTANITNVLTGAPDIVDGISLSVGDRVLVKDQSTGSQNGVYSVVTVGTGANGVWERAYDFNSNDDVYSGVSLYISEGTSNSGTIYNLSTSDPIVLDTTSLTFTGFSGSSGGIYGGSGTVPTSTVATTTDSVSFLGPAIGSGGGFYVGTSSGSARFHVLDTDGQMQLSYNSSHFTLINHDVNDLLFFKGTVTAEDSEARFLSNASSSYKIRFGYGNNLANSWNASSINIGGKASFRLTYGNNNPVTDPFIDIQTNGVTKLGMNGVNGGDVGIGISASGGVPGARLDVWESDNTSGNRIFRLRNGDNTEVFNVRANGDYYAYSTTVSEIQSGGVSDFTKGWLYLTNNEASLGFNVVGGLTKNGLFFTDTITGLFFNQNYVFQTTGSTTSVAGPNGPTVSTSVQLSDGSAKLIMSGITSSFTGGVKFDTNYGIESTFGDIPSTSSLTFVGSYPILESYSVVGAPNPVSAGAGALIFVSNESGGATIAFSDGANWRRVTDNAVIT